MKNTLETLYLSLHSQLASKDNNINELKSLTSAADLLSLPLHHIEGAPRLQELLDKLSESFEAKVRTFYRRKVIEEGGITTTFVAQDKCSFQNKSKLITVGDLFRNNPEKLLVTA